MRAIISIIGSLIVLLIPVSLVMAQGTVDWDASIDGGYFWDDAGTPKLIAN